MKRKNLLTQSQEQQDKEMLSFQIQEDKQQLEADKLETSKMLNAKERELVRAKSAVPFSPSNILSLQDEIKGLKAGLKGLKELEEELF